jgi:sRNA-binding carbon storage regulator CsrA
MLIYKLSECILKTQPTIKRILIMANGTLTLTRKPQQLLHLQFIDQDGKLQEVNLMISEINGQQAKVVIDAPKSVSITRGELLTRQPYNL